MTQQAVISGITIPVNTLLDFEIKRESLFIPDDVRDMVLNKVLDAWTKVKGNTMGSFPRDELMDISWQWVSDQGKLPKRLKNLLYKEFKFELSDYMVEQIGSVCMEKLPKQGKYHFDVTDQLHWRNGDFGDHESCFLNRDGSPTTSTKVMESSGKYFALRFFRPFPKTEEKAMEGVYHETDDNLFLGVSRSWLHVPDKEETLLFNSYGFNTSTSADLFGRYLGVSPTYIPVYEPYLHVNGCYGYLYSNSKEEITGSYRMDFSSSYHDTIGHRADEVYDDYDDDYDEEF